jgi:hypothetical protein
MKGERVPVEVGQVRHQRRYPRVRYVVRSIYPQGGGRTVVLSEEGAPDFDDGVFLGRWEPYSTVERWPLVPPPEKP